MVMLIRAARCLQEEFLETNGTDALTFKDVIKIDHFLKQCAEHPYYYNAYLVKYDS